MQRFIPPGKRPQIPWLSPEAERGFVIASGPGVLAESEAILVRTLA